MMRKLVSTILLLLVSTGGYPLGLGDIVLNSGLNQPFDARIELLSPTPSEMDSLAVRLADLEAFNRAGIELTMVLGSLRFEIVQNETGADYIHVTTREAVREPFLNFLLEASWSSGRLFREYTVLLDPPLYDPNVRQITTSGSSTAGSMADRAVEESLPVAPSASRTANVQRTTSTYRGDSYGPVTANNTLWSISNQVRPDAGVTTQQMMLALLRANPEAFIEGNINGLRQGAILRIPPRDELTSTSADAALAEVRSQNSMWEEMRGSFAGSASQRAVGSTAQPSAGGGTAASAAADSELRLVSPGSTSGSSQNAASSDATNGADLALANEQLETLASENEGLRDRLEETEALITDLRRLIELKDDELASLQGQMAGGGDIDTAEPDMEETSTAESTDAEPGVAMIEAPEEMMAEPVDGSAATEPQQTPPPPEVMTPSGSLVDSILTFIFGNIMLVGGAIVAVVIAIAGLTFIRKRKEAAVTEDDAPVTEFPDFEATADETDMAAAADIDITDEDDSAEADLDQDMRAAEPEAEAEQGLAAEAPAETVADEEPEGDPLAEVNVFLAYEHFDQAEEFVRDAIKKDPDNLDFHSKLLEVFYSSGDKAKYEEEARVLHDLVNGEGPHWEMAVIMWQEISPARALFAESADGEEELDVGDAKGGGIVDLTANSDSGDDDDSLDFDLGMGDSPMEEAGDKDDDILDITSDSKGSNDVLDLTGDSGNKQDEDLLDVTAAVGLGSHGGEDSGDEEDMLDISAAPVDEKGDPLDVTAQTDIDSDEDILDVTAAVGSDQTGESDEEDTPGGLDDNTLEFDVAGLDMGSADESESATADESDAEDENVIDFDTAAPGTGDDISLDMDSGSNDDGISLDMGPGEETAGDTGQGTRSDDSDDTSGGIDLDFTAGDNGDSAADDDLEISFDDSGEDNDGMSLDLDTDEASDGDNDLEISLEDSGENDDGGISLDMGYEDSDDNGGLSLDMDGDDSGDAEDGFSLEIDMDDDTGSAETPDIDMDSTVKIPKDANMGPDDDEEDDDDEDHTVFVPRTSDAGEQSTEDEVATKLDLAKAYVELGDNDSAGAILDEIIAEGDDAQRQQAKELKGQIS